MCQTCGFPASSSPRRDINAKLGEGRRIDALDPIALTVALEFPMLIDEGAAARMRERRFAYARELIFGENDYDPYSVMR